MSSKKVNFVLEADQAKAVEGILKVVGALAKAENKTKDYNKENKKTKKEVSGLGQVAQISGKQIMGMLGGFASLATITRGLQAVGREMDAIASKRKEFEQVALSAQQVVQKTAHLRGDVSQTSIDRVMADIKKISMQTGLGHEAAASTLFFSESQLGPGSKAAMSSAMNIAKFAAPAGLTAEEVKLIPKLFGAIGAKDNASQTKALNQLYKATGGSIAETGEFLEPFIRNLVTDVTRGFTYEQSLSRMTGAIGATGSTEQAATMARTAVDVASGRTEQALKYFNSQYLFEQAGKLGINPQDFIQTYGDNGKLKKFKKTDSIEDKLGTEGMASLTKAVKSQGGRSYSDLTDPQRFDWFSQFYAQNQSPAQMDALKTKVGSKGMNAVRAIMSSASQDKFKEMYPVVNQAGDQDFVGKMSSQFIETITAIDEQMKMRNLDSGARVGRESIPYNVLMEMTSQIKGQAKARAGTGGDVAKGIWASTALGKKATGHEIIQQIIAENLALSYEQGGNKGKILDLIKRTKETKSFTLNSPLLQEAFEATGGFSIIENAGKMAETQTLVELNKALNAGEPEYRYINSPYGSQILKNTPTNYFEGRESDYFTESMKSYFQVNNEKLEENTKATENLTEKLDQVINLNNNSNDINVSRGQD